MAIAQIGSAGETFNGNAGEKCNRQAVDGRQEFLHGRPTQISNMAPAGPADLLPAARSLPLELEEEGAAAARTPRGRSVAALEHLSSCCLVSMLAQQHQLAGTAKIARLDLVNVDS